ncbi:MAG: lipoyl(octanoyl) transferase LipB [Prolixibacteraceae bacterium]|nr:lipoyl(octanoyl) transferase LipB [Prolixibacteraceae bacterium]
MAEFNYIDAGSIDYKVCWDYQEKLLAEVVAEKNSAKNPAVKNFFLLVEHPHVYTLGKSGQADNMLISDKFLKKINASFYRINRGGDITYHGPGQLVGYPIIDLEYYQMGIREYIERMENAVMDSLQCYGIDSGRNPGATGVWLDAQNPVKARKICAIGVRVSRFVTMHGFALNINTDLRYFNYINPCGFNASMVTSMQNELHRPVDMEEVKTIVKANFNKHF